MKIEPLLELESITLSLEGTTSVLSAILSAMTEGSSAVESFVPALRVAWEYQFDLVKRLQELVDSEPVTKND